MRPLLHLASQALHDCCAVFTDIDDTLTTHGQMPAVAYAALERLAAAGIAVVPITGRPAGWCDMIARMWPVAGVVGENGALYFSYDRTAHVMRQRFFASAEERRANRKRLDVLREKILREVPGAGIASDQLYREADLAIDFCEDVPALPPDQVQRILDLFAQAGAAAQLLSIHVNGWVGNYDKPSRARGVSKGILGLDLEQNRSRMVFVGDSPNDGPMFRFFPMSCGVANVRDFLPGSFHPPAFVTELAGGEGFVQVADHILASRREVSHV